MSAEVKEEIPLEAKKLHQQMILEGKPSYTQEELMVMAGLSTPAELMKHAQILLNSGLLKILESAQKSYEDPSKQIMFAPISEDEAKRVSNMNNDEAMIYSHIEAAGREGIWTKTIKARTNLHQHIVLRCLKSLESQSYIKSVKSVKHPQRKIYMLYHLTPSIEVTGGPWFTDSELDTDFIESLLIIIWKYVATKTYPKCFKKKGLIANGLKQYSYPVENITGIGSILPTLQDISEFIAVSDITTIELSLSDIKSLCTVLEYDEKLESVNGGCYRATWQSILEAGGGKIEREDIYAPQNDKIFNISDQYRVMDSTNLQDDEDKKNVNENYRFYLDSWINI